MRCMSCRHWQRSNSDPDIRADWGRCTFWGELTTKTRINGWPVTMAMDHEPRGDSTCDMHDAHPSWKMHVTSEEAPPLMVQGLDPEQVT